MTVRLRHYYEVLGVAKTGVAVVLDLLDKYCALQQENKRLRQKA